MVTIPSHVVFKRVGDETVLLNFELGVYYGLDEVGTCMWELLADGKSTDEVVEAIVAAYDVTRETAAADLETLLGELRANGLLTGV